MKRAFTFFLLIQTATVFSQPFVPAPYFGENGVLRNTIWQGSEQFNSHALQPDGKLLLGGFGYWNTPNSFRIKMMRVDTLCGAVDQDFGDGGALSFTFEQRTTLYDMALQPDGAILGCGQVAPSNAGSQQKPAVYRLLPDGSPDLNFNESGYHTSGWDATSTGYFWRLFLLDDGRIACAGSSNTNINGGTHGIGVQRFMPDGTLDSTFAGNGIARRSLAGTGYTITGQYGSGIIQADSMVVAIGVVSAPSGPRIAMARFDYDGNPDTTLGNNGLLITSVAVATNEFPNDGIGAAVQADGRILVSGRSAGTPHRFLMVRFMPDGTLDNSYGDNGISVVTPPGNGPPVGNRMQLLEDGSTLQFGTSHWNSGPPTIVKRLADGSADPGFGTNGVLVVTTGATNEKFWNGLVLPGGDIIGIGGGAGSVLAVRLTQNPESDGSEIESQNGFDLFVNVAGDVQWFLNGAPIAGATSSTWTAQANGTYTAEITTPDGCILSTPPFEVTILSVGTGEKALLRAWPNPARDVLHIQGTHPWTMAQAIDIAGRAIPLSVAGGGRIDIGHLSPGTYVLRLGTADAVATVRFVKM